MNRRSDRIRILLRMAESGKSYTEIENKALSWGISQATARDYMKSVRAILLNIKEKNSEYKTKTNPQNNEEKIIVEDEEVIGCGSDILKR